MDTILKAANHCNMDVLDDDRGLAEAIHFVFQLNLPIYTKVDNQFVMHFIQRNRLRCKNTLFQLIELDCARELNKMKAVTPLEPHIRTKLTNFFHSENYNKKSTEIMDSAGKIMAPNFNEETKGFIQRDLMIILKG